MPDPDTRAVPGAIPPTAPDGLTDYLASQSLVSGEGTFPRDFIVNSITQASGSLRLAYFTARKTETITQVSIGSGSTPAGATPTLVRLGLYSVASNGDITLVASTANDTTLLAGATTVYTKALSASYQKVAGQRYAAGLLVVTGATAPLVMGNAAMLSNTAGQPPKLGGLVGGQTDLPASVVAASIADSSNRPYIVLLP